MVTQIFDIEERSYFNQNSSNNYYEANLYGCIPEPSGPSYFINVIYLPSKGPTNYPFKNNPLSSDAPRMLLLGAGLIAIARIGRKRVLK